MEFVNLQEGHHKQEAFLAINPAGTVPALEDGNVKGLKFSLMSEIPEGPRIETNSVTSCESANYALVIVL